MNVEKSSFEKNLQLVAKELDKLVKIREQKRKFDQEMSAAPVAQKVELLKCVNQSNTTESLVMDCYDDPEYDIEEVRFWNFMSRNKTNTKPSLIKTLVYRVPETAYVTKKSRVTIVEEKPQIEAAESKSTATVSSEPVGEAEREAKLEKERELKKMTKSSGDVPSSSKQHESPAASNMNQSIDSKFSEDDMIMIDEDDDIIEDYSDMIESEDENYSTSDSNEIIEGESEFVPKPKVTLSSKFVDSDSKNSPIKSSEFSSNSSVGHNESTDSDESYSRNKRFSAQPKKGAKKQKFTKRGPGRPPSLGSKSNLPRSSLVETNLPKVKPKIVSEKADEPISSINVKTIKPGRPGRPSRLNKEKETTTPAAVVPVVKAQRGGIAEEQTTQRAQQSQASVKTAQTSSANDASQDKPALRMTRSKAKLV